MHNHVNNAALLKQPSTVTSHVAVKQVTKQCHNGRLEVD